MWQLIKNTILIWKCNIDNNIWNMTMNISLYMTNNIWNSSDNIGHMTDNILNMTNNTWND